MNKRTLLISLVVLFAGFVLWGLLRRKDESSAPKSPKETQNQQQDTAQPNNPHALSSAPLAPGASRTPGTASQAVPDDVLRYIQNVKADPQYDWKQPIYFYGKVVDESNRPIADANIHFVWNDLSEKGTSETNAKSDRSGLFSFTDHQGKRLFVDVTKDGYYNSRQNPLAFEYANPSDGLFRPDIANPVVFHLRKKGEAERLIHGLKLFGARVDGTLSYVDLVEGKSKPVPPGDLAVQCVRSPPNEEKKFGWTFTLSVPDGGLIVAANEFDFLAPEGGYQPSFKISHKVNDSDWTGQEKRKFFVKSLDGQHYARIEITVIPDYNQNAAYDMEWFLNPSGSRNLEFDPNNAVQVGQ